MDDQQVVDQTRRWIAEMVIGLNLCPFARQVFEGDLIRYAMTATSSSKALLEVLRAELTALAASESGETTLVIHPHVFRDFLRFNDFLGDCERLVADLGLEGVIQVVGFHPDYQFEGTDVDAAENYTNRSPYPMLHLLREASISAAATAADDLLDIPRRNIAALRRLGSTELRTRLEMIVERPV
jgi:uncharacterized protein